MPTNIEKLSDEELVAAACEKILGWKYLKQFDWWEHMESGASYTSTKLPPLDGNLMLKIMVGMMERDWYFLQSTNFFVLSGQIVVAIRFIGSMERVFSKRCDDYSQLPRAVCIVALQTLEQSNA